MQEYFKEIKYEGFSLRIPVKCFKSDCYIEERQFNDAIYKTFGEIEKYKKAFEDAKNEKDKQISEMQAHIDSLKAELAELQLNKQELPLEPIEVAAMLIKSTVTRKANSIQKAFNCTDKYEDDRYSNDDLLQIAEHLLVYCKNAEEE